MTNWVKIKGTGIDSPIESCCADCGCEDSDDYCPNPYDSCCEQCGCTCEMEDECSHDFTYKVNGTLYCVDCDKTSSPFSIGEWI